MKNTQQPEVLIVGAGFAGMYALHRLQRLGYAAIVFEAGDDVGGTWFWNRYPGARCDVESIDYSYSFDQDLEQDWTWSERYPSQPELLAYARHVATRFELYDNIYFGTEITAADWDETTHRWTLTTTAGDTYCAPFCMMATGALSIPNIPEIPGLDTFAGKLVTTFDWPEELSDFTGERVGVVGTGSSGVQVIPEIAQTAEQLYVFQRTPSYSLPSVNRPLTSEESAAVKRNYPARRAAARDSFDGLPIDNSGLSACEVSERKRDAMYQEAYDNGAPFEFQSIFTDQLTDIDANTTAADFVAKTIEARVHDADTARTLIPTSYPIGTRRLCIDTDYYETFNRSHVTLVDLLDSPIDHIDSTAVVIDTTRYELDTLVLATGFDAVTGALNRIDIRGRHGQLLRDKWAAEISSYLGLMAHGFPNLFTISGPLSPSVLSNMMVTIEHHVAWITDCIDHLLRHDISHIEATAQAEAEWSQHAKAVADNTLYPLTDSWYMGANVEGKSHQLLPYAGGVGAYRRMTHEIAADNYRGFQLRS